MSNTIEAKIGDMIASEIDAAGYNLVRVLVKGSGQHATLQIMAERRDDAGMTVEDCAAISKLVTAKIESDKDLADRYDLEVSSPGIDRPLVKLQDFERYQGFMAKIELDAPVEGQRRFEAKIVSVGEGVIGFMTEQGAVNVPFSSVDKAKLVLTNELLKAAASGKVSH